MNKKHLLRVCQPIEDENFWGYLIRLAEVNYYERATLLNQLTEAHKYTSQPRIALARDLHLGMLSEMTGIAEKNLRLLTYPDLSDEGTHNLFAGHIVGRNSIKSSPAKVCPLCLKEHSYARKIWDLTAYTTCAVHKIPLVNACPSCNKKISWSRAKINKCSCGFDFTEINSAEISEEEGALQHHIYNLVYNKPEQNRGPLSGLKLGELLRLIDFMAGQVADVINTKGTFLNPRPLEKTHEYIVKAYKIFCDWPNNFNKFLNDLRDNPKTGSIYQRKTGLVKDFGSFYLPLYRYLKEAKYDFIRSSFEDYLTDWDGGHLRDCDMPFSEDFRKKSKYIGVNEASRKLEMAPKRVQRLLEAGLLTGTSVEVGATTLYRIEKNSIKRLKEILDNSLSQQEVAKRLGITIAVVRKLVEAELLKPFLGKTVLEDDFEWVFLPHYIDQFINRIKSAVNIAGSNNKLINIEEARNQLSLLKYGYAEVIKIILLGELTIYGEAIDKDGLVSIKFNADEVAQFAKLKFNEIRNESLTLEEAAESLQVRLKSLRYWARKGCLNTVPPKGRDPWSISLEELNSFKENYVITAPIARYHGISPGKLINILDTLEVKPVSGPTLDGQHQYLYLRQDIESAGFDTTVAWQKDGPYRSRKLTKKIKQQGDYTNDDQGGYQYASNT